MNLVWPLASKKLGSGQSRVSAGVQPEFQIDDLNDQGDLNDLDHQAAEA